MLSPSNTSRLHCRSMDRDGIVIIHQTLPLSDATIKRQHKRSVLIYLLCRRRCTDRCQAWLSVGLGDRKVVHDVFERGHGMKLPGNFPGIDTKSTIVRPTLSKESNYHFHTLSPVLLLLLHTLPHWTTHRETRDNENHRPFQQYPL